MASTNKTTNYELSQFEGTDKPSWEADYNADMLIIDTNMKAISDVANGASGDISTLDGRLTTAEGNISTNANDIDALEGRADALEAGQTSDDSRLDALEAEQIVQNTAIESNTRLGYNLARPYDSASTYAVGAYVLFQDTLYKCTTAISTGEAFDPNKWLAIKATDEIAAGGTTIEVLQFNDPADFTLIGPNTLSIFNLDHQSPTVTTQTPTNSRIVEASLTYTKINNVKMLNGLFVINFDTISNLPATCGIQGSFGILLPNTIENPSANIVNNFPASLPFGSNSGINISYMIASRCSAELISNRVSISCGYIESGNNVTSLSVRALGVAFSATYI